MSEELKPCPFCGGEAHIDGTSWRPTDGSEVAWVTCKRCGAYGPTLPVKQTIAAWNTRAADDDAVAAERARIVGIVLRFTDKITGEDILRELSALEAAQ